LPRISGANSKCVIANPVPSDIPDITGVRNTSIKDSVETITDFRKGCGHYGLLLLSIHADCRDFRITPVLIDAICRTRFNRTVLSSEKKLPRADPGTLDSVFLRGSTGFQSQNPERKLKIPPHQARLTSKLNLKVIVEPEHS
jgi:hypothetical protein